MIQSVERNPDLYSSKRSLDGNTSFALQHARQITQLFRLLAFVLEVDVDAETAPPKDWGVYG